MNFEAHFVLPVEFIEEKNTSNDTVDTLVIRRHNMVNGKCS
jgi:hypothetical protein